MGHYFYGFNIILECSIFEEMRLSELVAINLRKYESYKALILFALVFPKLFFLLLEKPTSFLWEGKNVNPSNPVLSKHRRQTYSSVIILLNT